MARRVWLHAWREAGGVFCRISVTNLAMRRASDRRHRVIRDGDGQVSRAKFWSHSLPNWDSTNFGAPEFRLPNSRELWRSWRAAMRALRRSWPHGASASVAAHALGRVMPGDSTARARRHRGHRVGGVDCFACFARGVAGNPPSGGRVGGTPTARGTREVLQPMRHFLEDSREIE